MNTVKFIHQSEEYCHILFDQGFQPTQEWLGHVITYIQTLPQTLANNSNALLATIAIANTLFFFTLNATTQYIENKICDQRTKNYKIIFTSELCAAFSIWGFNILLSKITQIPITQQKIAAITIVALTLRILFNRMPSTTESEQQEQVISPATQQDEIEEEVDQSFSEAEAITHLKDQLAEERSKLLKKDLENKRNEDLIKAAELNEKKLNQKISILEKEIQEKQEKMNQEQARLKLNEEEKEEAWIKERTQFESKIQELTDDLDQLSREKIKQEKLQKKIEEENKQALADLQEVEEKWRKAENQLKTIQAYSQVLSQENQKLTQELKKRDSDQTKVELPPPSTSAKETKVEALRTPVTNRQLTPATTASPSNYFV